MARKSTVLENEVEQIKEETLSQIGVVFDDTFTPSADDKSENFDFLATVDAGNGFADEPDVKTFETVYTAPAPTNIAAKGEIIDGVLRQLLLTASRFDGQTYEDGQWGNREFTFTEVYLLCYRVELPLSDAAIMERLQGLAKLGVLVKVGSKKWTSSPVMQMTMGGLDALKKTLLALRDMK